MLALAVESTAEIVTLAIEIGAGPSPRDTSSRIHRPQSSFGPDTAFDTQKPDAQER